MLPISSAHKEDLAVSTTKCSAKTLAIPGLCADNLPVHHSPTHCDRRLMHTKACPRCNKKNTAQLFHGHQCSCGMYAYIGNPGFYRIQLRGDLWMLYWFGDLCQYRGIKLPFLPYTITLSQLEKYLVLI